MDGPRTVADIMTSQPVCVRRDEPLEVARSLMVSCDLRHLLVEEQGRPVGIVSLCDVLRADGREIVEEVMRGSVPMVAPGHSLMDAAWRLLCDGLPCFAVVDEGRLAGIVTPSSFMPAALATLRREPLRVTELMTAQPLWTVRSDDTLALACETMAERRVRHLPVVDGERLVGLISDRDLLAAQGLSLGERRVRDALRTRVVSVSPDDDAGDACEQLRRRRLSAVPVQRRQSLVGMLTVRDFFHHYMTTLSAQRRKWA